MTHITFLPSSATAVARIRTALDGDRRLTVARSWDELLHLLHQDPPTGCIIDMDYRDRRIGVCDLEMIRAEHPRIALVVYGSLEGRGFELFHMGRVGVDEIIRAEKGDAPAEIWSAISRAVARALANRIGDELESRIPDLGLRCLRWAVEHAHEGPLVSDLASAVRTSPRALSRSLRSVDLPPANRILMWGRLFRAVHLLEDLDVTVERAAYRVGYSTGGALRRALRRETGVPPTEVSGRGGVLWVLDSFVRSAMQGRSSRERLRWDRARSRRRAEAPLLDPYG